MKIEISKVQDAFFSGLYHMSEALGHDLVINIQRIIAPDNILSRNNFEPVFDIYLFAREDKYSQNLPIAPGELSRNIKKVLFP